MDIKGKTLLITGGSAGLGLEAAKQFLQAGAKVIVTGRSQQKLEKARLMYPGIVTIKSDVSDPADLDDLFAQIADLGGIDMLYNNAGVGSPSLDLGRQDEQHFENASDEMNINYLAVIRLVNKFIVMLETRESAAIINTTSVLSYLPSVLAPTYSASKAALRFYTESLRKHLEIKGSKVKVFELLPPLVDTEMTEAWEGKKITTTEVIRTLISGLQKDHYTIRVNVTKVLYAMNRLSPALAFNMLNQKNLFHLIK